MNRRGKNSGAALVRFWARIYTASLPALLRDTRRGEIDADLHDQIAELREQGKSPAVAAFSVAIRALRGMPQDIVWRLEVQSGLANKRSGRAQNAQARWIVACAVIAAAVMLPQVLMVPSAGPALHSAISTTVAIRLVALLCVACLYALHRLRITGAVAAGLSIALVTFGAEFFSRLVALGTRL